MEVLAVALLLTLKLAAYTLWCWIGLRFLSAAPPSWPRAAAHGLLRLVLGLVLGFTLVFALGSLAPAQNRLGLSPVALLASMALVRHLEWCLVGALLLSREWTPRGLLGGSARMQGWRLGGLLLSFLTDVGALLGVGAAGLMPC